MFYFIRFSGLGRGIIELLNGLSYFISGTDIKQNQLIIIGATFSHFAAVKIFGVNKRPAWQAGLRKFSRILIRI